MEEKRYILSQLPALLLPWYRQNRRELPWRQDREPYHIWISEIMLQQTRVEAVKGYYHRFLTALPTVFDLAQADDEQLTKLWEGLGYYSRVRNLKKAAQVIVREYAGVFPSDHGKILSLPGIGAYTAGAIASIAFGQKTPAVDGNVLRVYSRLTDDDTPVDSPKLKKQVTELLAQIYPQEAGDFTQALMELGATVCGPNRKPCCEECPCKDICLAFHRSTAEQRPVKQPRRERRTEEYTVFILESDGCYALEKRPENGLLAGLWQFPNTPGHLDTTSAIACLRQQGIAVTEVLRRIQRSHIFTHVQWDMQAYYLRVAKPEGDFQWLSKEQIGQSVALPTAFRIFYDLMEE